MILKGMNGSKIRSVSSFIYHQISGVEPAVSEPEEGRRVECELEGWVWVITRHGVRQVTRRMSARDGVGGQGP